MLQEREIPQNIEAEQSVLGAMLIDKNAVELISEQLKPEDFYRQTHQVIFKTMMELHSRKEAVDMVTVINELKKTEKLNDVGGISYITFLAGKVPTAANATFHARIVVEKSILRQLVETGTSIAAMGYDDAGSVTDILKEANKSILQIAKRKTTTDFVPVKDLIEETIKRIEVMQTYKEPITGLRTGFKDLDYLTAGMHPSDFIILAARPSMGKTALALNIAQNVAIRGAQNGESAKRVAIFSLEMGTEQLVQRMLCAEACVDAQKLRSGLPDNLGDNDRVETIGRLWSAVDRLKKAQIFIDEEASSIRDMRSKAKRLQAEGGLDLIIIDYLQLMKGTAKRQNTENRNQEVSEISRGLKVLARELNVPVLALSQLSRNVEKRTIKKPMLSDLRESGSLEQDADIVMLLYRDDYYKENEDDYTYITELNVAKHRNGPIGTIYLFFKSEWTKFVSLSKKPDDGVR
ncbi:MAG: replicative DNA helicase [Acidaminococcaceae bacterium]|nr:replicative DNA helicase [Acidaminococcaceae bacterium]